MAIFIASVLIALSVSALCSLLEATLLSYTPSQVAALSQRRPRLGAIWQDFKTHIDRPIGVILVLNTAAHTIGASMAGAYFETLFGIEGLIWFSLLFTYVMLQFTEILPKSVGVRHNGWVAPLMAVPLALLVRLFTPLLWLIHLVNRPFMKKPEAGHTPATLEEITALAGLARLSQLLSPQQERIIQGATRLSDKSVREVMIPVDMVSFLSTTQTLLEAIVTAHLEPHTRFPICEAGDRNKVLGYVNFKEMVYQSRTNPDYPTLEGIIRPVHFVTPDRSATELLKIFVTLHEHMAIVRDEAGQTLGLVTLEDIIEELVGELEDEFDRLPRMIHPLQRGTWMVGGGVPVAELVAKLAIPLSEVHGTLSSWLSHRLGHQPKTNDVYREGGLDFMVRRLRRGKIFEVQVTRKAPAP